MKKNDLTSDCQLVIFTSFFLLQNKRALLRKYFAAALSSFDELYNIYSALLDIHCILRDRIAERIWTRRVDSYQAISRYDCCSPRRRWPPMDPAPQWGHSKNQCCILRKRSLCAKIVYEWSKNPNVDDRFQAQTTCLLFLYVTSSNNISKNYYCIICLILEVSTYMYLVNRIYNTYTYILNIGRHLAFYICAWSYLIRQSDFFICYVLFEILYFIVQIIKRINNWLNK